MSSGLIGLTKTSRLGDWLRTSSWSADLGLSVFRAFLSPSLFPSVVEVVSEDCLLVKGV